MMQWKSQRTFDKRRRICGRNTFSRNSQNDTRGPTQVNYWGCGGPHFCHDFIEASPSVVYREGKETSLNTKCNHGIHATFNNNYEEHQSTIVDSASSIASIKIKILFIFGAIASFVSSYALDKCRLETHKRKIEVASGELESIESSVEECVVDLGVCSTK